jgi:hypothetical protein
MVLKKTVFTFLILSGINLYPFSLKERLQKLIVYEVPLSLVFGGVTAALTMGMDYQNFRRIKWVGYASFFGACVGWGVREALFGEIPQQMRKKEVAGIILWPLLIASWYGYQKGTREKSDWHEAIKKQGT